MTCKVVNLRMLAVRMLAGSEAKSLIIPMLAQP